MSDKKGFYVIKANADPAVGELYLYGDIVPGEWAKWDDEDRTAANIRDELAALGDITTLNIYINSGGGDVFQGQAIYSILKRHSAEKNVFIDGLAASAASFIAMAGDTVIMPRNAMIMVHNPWTIALGFAEDLRTVADMLDKVREAMKAAYLAKIKITDAELTQLLDAESWLTADEAYTYGFADEIADEVQIAASVSPEILSRYQHVPESLKAALKMGAKTDEKAVEARNEEVASLKKQQEEVRHSLAAL